MTTCAQDVHVAMVAQYSSVLIDHCELVMNYLNRAFTEYKGTQYLVNEYISPQFQNFDTIFFFKDHIQLNYDLNYTNRVLNKALYANDKSITWFY